MVVHTSATYQSVGISTLTYHKHDDCSSRGDPLVSLARRETGFSHLYIKIMSSIIQVKTSNKPYPRDGIFLEVGRLRCEVRPGPLLLLLEAHAVPMVRQRGGLPLPVLQEGHSCQKGGRIYGVSLRRLRPLIHSRPLCRMTIMLPLQTQHP